MFVLTKTAPAGALTPGWGLTGTPVWRWSAVADRTCSFSGCGDPVYQIGLCNGHVKQYRAGKALVPKKPRLPDDTDTSRWCTKCETWKPLDEFSLRASKATRARRCSSCVVEQVKNWRDANPGRRAAADKAARQRDPEKFRQTQRDRRDPAKHAIYSKRYYEKNKEKYVAWTKTYRRELQASGVFEISARDRRRLAAQACQVCGAAENLHIDHIIPVKRGGRHSIGNLQMLCQFHNCSKRHRTMTEYRVWLKSLQDDK